MPLSYDSRFADWLDAIDLYPCISTRMLYIISHEVLTDYLYSKCFQMVSLVLPCSSLAVDRTVYNIPINCFTKFLH